VAPDAILGRDQELAAITSFFDDERSGPRALLLEGDAGIGKTTLWRESVRLAESKGLVLSSRASEAETRLSFTVLGDLLVPASVRAFDRLSDALKEIIDARVWGGIHFRTADVQGAVLGKKVGRYMERHYFKPTG
jgi:predicted ATPase